jgi:ABC-type amino acid transport substrate-binding protein
LIGGMGVAALALSTKLSFAASLEEVKKRGIMHVVTEGDFYPYEFVRDAEPDGFDKDAIDELPEYVPFKVEQEILPWTGLLAAVTAGKHDAAMTGAGVDSNRLLGRIRELGAIGRDDKGRLVRLAASDSEKQGRDRFVSWLKDAGLAVVADRVGNIVGIWSPESEWERAPSPRFAHRYGCQCRHL